MEIPQYVTVDEVKRVCKALNLSDWTAMKGPKVSPEEGRIILKEVNYEGMNIDIEDFCMGLEVELEHGTRFSDANVTNNHPILTGKIVLAHLKESLDYYKRLEVAELEGDLLQALAAGNSGKVESKLRKLVKARLLLSEAEVKQLN
ncbi:MAG: hypothetical protein HZC49_00955 [Nitrospirae bacterium]|nr:hypothetical protein [Nitrospirota bacterium]